MQDSMSWQCHPFAFEQTNQTASHGEEGGVKLTTDAQVVPSGGTSLQSQSAAKAALRGRGGAGTAADEDVPAVLGLLGPVLGLLGPVLGLFAGLLAPDAEDGEAGATVSAVHLHRPQVDAQKPFGFAELVLVIKLAEQAPKPFCIAEQRECAQKPLVAIGGAVLPFFMKSAEH
ncbi:hypothetical protein ABBQ32_002523 [Trebouxia sp. C0010 RCD-2024]